MNKRNSRIFLAGGLLFAAICLAGSPSAMAQAGTAKTTAPPKEINDLLSKYTCLACHKTDARLVGPAYQDVAKKKYTNNKIVELIYKPQPTNWPGYPPMAAMTQVPKADALKFAVCINSLTKTPAKAKPAAKKS